VEGRYAHFQFPSGTVMAAGVLPLAGNWSVVLEAGAQVLGRVGPRGALGVRYAGPSFGMALGAAYVAIEDPLLPGGQLPVIPAFDLSWSF
jgi:hypothetical protein